MQHARAVRLKPLGNRLGGGKRGLAQALAWSVLTVALAHAPAAAEDRGPVRSMLEMRHEGVIVQDWDLSCGAAALATILTYQHGDPVTEEEVTRGLIRREEYLENPELVRIREGFSLLDLKRFVEARGYQGIGFGRLEFDDLLDYAPIIVPVSLVGYNHFVIFRGVVGDRVLLADPAFGNRTISIDRFQNAWMDLPELGRVGFIVARGDSPDPPGRLAADPRELLAPPDSAVRQTLTF